MADKERTINEALGIPNEWKKSNTKLLRKEIEKNDTISEAMEASLMRIKEEVFGEGTYANTEFEKKLIYAGFMLAQEIMDLKQQQARAVIMGSILSGFSSKPDEDDDDDDDE
jgi:hypothetical protein